MSRENNKGSTTQQQNPTRGEGMVRHKEREAAVSSAADVVASLDMNHQDDPPSNTHQTLKQQTETNIHTHTHIHAEAR